MPHVDPLRKIGRINLCPCGSGKKYKVLPVTGIPGVRMLT